MDKAQLQIRIGRAVCGPDDPDAPALEVATRILSERLAENLREKQGLAYSVGAGLGFAPQYGWLSCSMGTAAENYERAVEGILAQIENMRTSAPDEQELLRAKNQIRGRMLTRRLARENQCYYMALNEFLGLGYEYDDREAARLGGVTAADVQRVAAKYYSSTDYYLVTVGDLGEAAPQAGTE